MGIMGRPKGINKMMVSVRLPIWLAKWLCSESRARRYSQARIIEDALVEKHELQSKGVSGEAY